MRATTASLFAAFLLAIAAAPLWAQSHEAEVGTRVSVRPMVQEASEGEPSRGEHRVRVFRWDGLDRGYLGVDVLRLTPELRTHFGVPEDVGVLVASLTEGGPAEASGIRVGDILSAVDGERVDSVNGLARRIREREAGEMVTIELYRNGGIESYPVTIAERERPVVDFSGGYRFLPDMPELADRDVVITMDGIHLDESARQAMDDAMRELEDRFDRDELRERFQRLQNLDFGAIQDRMREVEERLKELERELAEERARDERL